LSVYPELSPPGIDETSPTLSLTDEQADALSRIKVLNPLLAEKLRALYGHLKVLCERTVEDVMPGRVLNIRPGLIVGPYDYHESFTYWVHRVAQGGEVLAPGRAGQAVQLIDARDLAGWIIQRVEARRTANYNATGPNYALTMQHLLQECINTCGSNACLAWVSSQFLIEASATKTELPLWHPEARVNGLAFVNCGKAIAAGLAFRPLGDTARDTLAWDVTRPQNVKRRVGLPPERESQLLQAWHCQALASQLRN
jgi:2'-hydroxyisoflavone reductase